MRKPLSHDAYVRELNRQMQKHPNYREGMRVTKVNGSLHEMAPPEHQDPDNAQAMQELCADLGLQRVLWDSVSVVQKKYYYASEYLCTRMLPRNLLFRISGEGRRSVLLQSRLKTLHSAIVAHKRVYGSWPVDVVPLIQSHHLMNPWKTGELLQVNYMVPKDETGDVSPQDLLAEYVREGKRRFVLFADGHQETSKL